MVEPSPRLRVVGEGESPPKRRRGPGLAVLLVLLYAFAFAVVLWLLWGQVRRGRPASPPAPPSAAARPAAARDRMALLTGEGLLPSARAEYLRELSADICDCGCQKKLQACLARDRRCSRSPELAEERWRKLH